MPLFLIPLAIGGVAGFVIGDGADSVGRAVKWVVIGGAVFLVAKKMMVI